MAALVSIKYKQSIFFQSDPHTVIANKSVFTSVHSSNYTLKGLRSDKPWHKHDSNKCQSKGFLICDHRSDQIRSAMSVNKTYLVWSMYWLLFNQYYQHRTNQKLFKIVGLQASVSFSPLPLPRSSVFLPPFQLSQWTHVETLATQVNLFYLISPQLLLMFSGKKVKALAHLLMLVTAALN